MNQELIESLEHVAFDSNASGASVISDAIKYIQQLESELQASAAQSAGVPEQIEELCASMNIIDTLQRPGMSLRDLEAVNAEKNVLANKVRRLIARYAATPSSASSAGF